MMKKPSPQTIFAAGLVTVSAVIFAIQIREFHHTQDTVFYLLQDLAFLPIQVLLVTFILNRFLEQREKTALLQKMNMAIGIFFSECGNPLLKALAAFDARSPEVRDLLRVSTQWTAKDFSRVLSMLKQHPPALDCGRGDLPALRALLLEKRTFLLSLLENPNLLEHDAFTDLLQAVFHLTEELSLRPQVAELTPHDAEHLAGDLKRVHSLLYTEWLAYLAHLKENFPYLFSLAVRQNPLDPAASVEIR